MPPKKPSLSNIFKTPKKSPSGAIDLALPPELPSINITPEDVEKIIKETPSSPTCVKDGINLKDLNSFRPDIDTIIKNKLCESKGVILSSPDDKGNNTAYYIKCVDKQGTPFYIDLDRYSGTVPSSNDVFQGNMIKIRKTEATEDIKYLIASNRKTDHIIECGDDKFCVVKNNDDGTHIIDIFEIPKEKELNDIKNQIELTQVKKSEGTLDLEPRSAISYKIVSYSVFVNENITPESLARDNLEFYNRQLKSAFDLIKINMNNVDGSFNDLGIIITSFKKNKDLAIERTEELKKKILKQNAITGSDVSDKRNKLEKINNSLEEYIRISNIYNSQFVAMQKIYREIFQQNNDLVDKYQHTKTETETK